MPGAKTYDVQIDDDAAFVGAPNPVATPNNSYTPENPPVWDHVLLACSGQVR